MVRARGVEVKGRHRPREHLKRKRVTEALWKPNHCMSTIADRARQGMVCT